MTQPTKAESLETVSLVAKSLKELVHEVVFVGGSSAAFLITDEDIVSVRATLDVDIIVELINRPDYYRFQERLFELGFKPDPDGPQCRFTVAGITVDVMPDDEKILGFSNQWYTAAIESAQEHTLDDIAIRVVSAPLFLATKLEAFHGRGNRDYMGSHDIEDLVAVIDGRPSIVKDCFDASADVKSYLKDNFSILLADGDFLNTLPGLVDQDGGSGRAQIIRQRLQGLVSTLRA
ncbi:MAG: hypothetical protein AB8G17_05955 [Gammaproteobacteria bacterium]